MEHRQLTLTGWTSPDGREFALVLQTDGTAFVEVGPDGSLDYVGRLPTQTGNSLWRDSKVIGNFAYIGSEASGHGLQIFDLTKLLVVKPFFKAPNPPKTFSVKTDLTALFDKFGNSHNIVANVATNMIYAVGTGSQARCSGGLYMVDVSNPAKPVSPGCVSNDGYVHDAQCVVYSGVDTEFVGHEICFNYNEDTLTIVDITDKKNPVQLSRTAYKGHAYTHQGWLTSADMKYLVLDDELDEMDGTVPDSFTRTYIFDVGDLTKPVHTGTYKGPALSIDHNQYIKEGLSYQANYRSGLRVVDVRSIPSDPTGGTMKQVGFFDCDPTDDKDTSGAVDFGGSWGVYPFFASGFVVLNSIERGLFSLKYTG